MQQSTHSHLHMPGRRNQRKHALYYRLQEHHVITTTQFLVISNHDFIRSSLITLPPSSFCRLLTSSALNCPAPCHPFMSVIFPINLHQHRFFRFYFTSAFISAVPIYCVKLPYSCRHSWHKKTKEGCHCKSL